VRFQTALLTLALVSACSDSETYELQFALETVTVTVSCPQTLYCAQTSPATGELPPGRLVMKDTPHLFVRNGCEGDGERKGDSVIVAIPFSLGGCYGFDFRARVDGNAVTGRWTEQTDCHYGAKRGSLTGVR
jgi:hypothetical protein